MMLNAIIINAKNALKRNDLRDIFGMHCKHVDFDLDFSISCRSFK